MQRPMRHFCPMLQTVLRRKPLEICLLRLSTQDHYANLGCCNEWWYIRAILPNSQAHKNDHQCVQWSTGMASYCFLLQVSVESVLTLHDTYTFQNDSLQAFDFSSGLTSTTSTAVSYTEQSGNEWERERERERERDIYIYIYYLLWQAKWPQQWQTYAYHIWELQYWVLKTGENHHDPHWTAVTL